MLFLRKAFSLLGLLQWLIAVIGWLPWGVRWLFSGLFLLLSRPLLAALLVASVAVVGCNQAKTVEKQVDGLVTDGKKSLQTLSKSVAQPQSKLRLGSLARVEWIYDGDTVKVRYKRSGLVRKVRLALVDAPEMSSTRFGAAECGGASAANYLRTLIKGRTVDLRRVPSENHDRYGRLVRELWLNGRSIDQMLVRAGWAKQYSSTNPNVNQRVERAAARAKQQKLGVWKSCNGFNRPLKP